jgi:hypothetical protein
MYSHRSVVFEPSAPFWRIVDIAYSWFTLFPNDIPNLRATGLSRGEEPKPGGLDWEFGRLKAGPLYGDDLKYLGKQNFRVRQLTSYHILLLQRLSDPKPLPIQEKQDTGFVLHYRCHGTCG